VPVDYNDAAAVTAALKGVDAIVATLGFTGLQLQVPIAKAAKAAGVRLFAPSEFGVPTDSSSGPFAVKHVIAEEIHALGLPTARVFTGGFSDFIWGPCVFVCPSASVGRANGCFGCRFMGLDVKSGKVSVGVDGNAKISFTSRPDIARYVAHAFTRFPLEQLQNKSLRIQGDGVSFNEVFEAYEIKHNKKVHVTYIPIDELKKRIAKNPNDISAILHLEMAEGRGFVGEPLDNDKWPEWKPSKVIEYL
jgi:hypothetical protein